MYTYQIITTYDLVYLMYDYEYHAYQQSWFNFTHVTPITHYWHWRTNIDPILIIINKLSLKNTYTLTLSKVTFTLTQNYFMITPHVLSLLSPKWYVWENRWNTLKTSWRRWMICRCWVPSDKSTYWHYLMCVLWCQHSDKTSYTMTLKRWDWHTDILTYWHTIITLTRWHTSTL